MLAVNPDWRVSTASVCLNAASSASSSSWIVIVPAIVRTAPEPAPSCSTASMAARRIRGWWVRPEVVVGREADHAPVVDRGDRALGRRHHAQRPVQVALAQRRQLVVEVGEGVRACRGHGVASSVASLGTQSRMTLPEPPERAAANAASWSRNPNRSVIAGVMSSPDWSITVILYQVSYISRP